MYARSSGQLGSLWSNVADLYNTPGNEVREAEEEAVFEAFGVTPDNPSWPHYRDLLNSGAELPGDPGPGGPPHISQAPEAYQIEELVAQMARFQGGGFAGLQMPKPDWASPVVWSKAQLAYQSFLAPASSGGGSGGGEDDGDAPTVELGLEYPTTTAGIGGGALTNYLAIGAVGLALLFSRKR